MSRPYRERLVSARLPAPRWLLARVVGHSMEPTLLDGDLLLVDRRRAIRPATVAVVLLPDRTTAVKRVTSLQRDGWWVERDNPRHGVDSWSVGAIPDRDVVGLVVARLWPRPVLVATLPAPGAAP